MIITGHLHVVSKDWTCHKDGPFVIANQHVTCAKVDLEPSWHYSVFARASLSTFNARLSGKEPSPIRTSITLGYVRSITIHRNEVNDKPTRLTLVVMTQEQLQDKAERATPHVFSVTDGFQPN